MLNYITQCIIADIHVGLLDIMVRQYSRQQVPARYLHLLFKQIAGNFNNFHTVEQRLRQSGECVGCGYEQHVGEVEVHIYIIVVEMAVLFRVQYLEKGCRRITFEIGTDFVHFIEQYNRIL